MEQSKQGLTPVECAINAFGSAYKLALALKVNRSRVSRWRTGRGLIPDHHQKTILAMALERGLDLTAEDIVRGRCAPEVSA